MLPELVEFCAACSGFAYPGGDVCKSAAIIPEDDSQVFGSVVMGDCGLVCEVNGVVSVHFHVNAFAFVE